MVTITPGRPPARMRVASPAAHGQEASAEDWGAVLEDLGMVAVPVKPTMEQIAAATHAAEVSVEEAWRVYTAMLTAAEPSQAR